MMSRNVSGFLLLDKPLGLSSNAALQRCKRLSSVKKVGHTGSLDPLATGMLPLCFGEATKFSQYLLNADKTYEVEGTLGQTTITGDAEGGVTATFPVPDFSITALRTELSKWVGELLQVPPMYSALKRDGKKLYELARQGIEVVREPRPITVFELELLDFASPVFSFRVRVSKGTYIRTLVEDIGKALGCGAFVSRLRRLSVAGFAPDEMITLEQFAALTDSISAFIPIESAFLFYPIVHCSLAEQKILRATGELVKGGQAISGLVRLYGEDNRFFGLGRQEAEKLSVERLLAG